MKNIILYILAVAVLFAACYLIVSARRSAETPPAKTAEPTAPQQPSTASPPGPDGTKEPDVTAVPASGTDLYIPEPLSGTARAALDGLYGQMRSQDCQLALAWLGTVPADTPLAEYLERSGLLKELAGQGEAYGFLPELTPAQCAAGGFENLYCLVPQSGCTQLRVLAGEQLLYQGEGDGPALFTGDSNGFRLSITTAAGETLEFSLSPLADGRLEPQAGLVDFTI